MTYQSIITALYYLVIYADGDVNEKELALGKQMLKVEGFKDDNLETELEKLKATNTETLLTNCIAALKKLSPKDQIKSIAWMSVIANSDGFMDKEEWILIYRIYHTELKLSLDDIMKIQKELNMIVHGKAFQSLGVRVSK